MNKSKNNHQRTGRLNSLIVWQMMLCLIVFVAMSSGSEIYAQSDAKQVPGGPGDVPGGFPDPFATAQEGEAVQPEQAFVVNERFAGWREAGNDTEELGNSLRANWVMAGPYGAINGRLAGIEGAHAGNLTITLLNNCLLYTSPSPRDRG